MKQALLLLILCSLSPLSAGEKPAQVMLMGTFHFTSPGKDIVKTENIDVMTETSQAYLEALVRKIADEFRPTVVMLEYSPEIDERANERYAQYLAGEWDLPVNEIFQVGFRLAQASGLERVDSFDHRDIHWQSQAMLDYAKVHEPEAFAAFESRMQELTEKMQRAQSTLSLKELLARSNERDDWEANKALYIETNAIGAGVNFHGADSSASWWHRNFRMYALVQKAATPGERVFVLGGSGHIAILSDLLALDKEREAVAALPMIRGASAER